MRRSLNLWSKSLMIAVLISAISLVAIAQEDSTDSKTTSESRDIQSTEVKTELDPEGLAGKTDELEPSKIDPDQQALPLAEKQAAADKQTTVTEEKSTEKIRAESRSLENQALVPLVASRDPQDAQTPWDGTRSVLETPGGLKTDQIQSKSLAAAAEQYPSYEMPRLKISTLAPKQANIHRTTDFRFVVENTGPFVAESVNLAIGISGHGQVVSIYPEGGVHQGNVIYFSLGNLGIHEQRELGFEFQAAQAGKIHVHPKLTYSATSEISVEATAPKVDIEFDGADQFVVGQQVSQNVIIRNQSTVTIENISIRQACTPSVAFENASFENNQFMIRSLGPGQAHKMLLTATAIQPGKATMKVAINGDNIRGDASKDLTFTQSQLAAEIQGPELIYLNSLGTYHIAVANDQAHDVNNVKVQLSLPRSMIVKVIDRKAEFDAASSSITWTLPTLPANHTETIPFKAIISQIGQYTINASIANRAGMMTHTQMKTHVIGRADIDLKVITNSEPIEIGSTTSIIVQIQNRGTNTAADVEVQLELPDAIEIVESADHISQGQTVTFKTFELAPGQTHNLTVPVKSNITGDHLVRATVKSSASTKTIGAENSLFFFSSRNKRTANRDQR